MTEWKTHRGQMLFQRLRICAQRVYAAGLNLWPRITLEADDHVKVMP